MERFNVSSPTEAVPVVYARQNCYKIGGRVHIEFQATTQQEMTASMPWAMIPKKYAPNTKYGSNTGYTGICVMETTNDYATTLCSCYANPPAENSNYGLVYQSVSSEVVSGKRVMISMDYYI